jgi:hypothetical protein
MKFFQVTFKNSSSDFTTQHLNTKTDQLILCKEIIPVHLEDQTKHLNKFCGKLHFVRKVQMLLTVKQIVYVVNAVL